MSNEPVKIRRAISVENARTHNLRNLSVEIPHRELTVITGPSGSGKSSLAFDTIYAEGQRRFVESMSTYVRQFLERMERPDVDQIDGILPALAIEQKNSVKNARSTVATATELADYMRLFMTYTGETFCPDCGVRVSRETPQSVADLLMERDGSRLVITAPVAFPETTKDRPKLIKQLLKGGYFRVWIDGRVEELENFDTSALESLQVLIDRVRIGEKTRPRLTEALEHGFLLGTGSLFVWHEENDGWIPQPFHTSFACNRCGQEVAEPRPHLFSFNSPLGACENCQGYGRVIGVDYDKVIPNRRLRLDELPVEAWNSPGYEDCYEDMEAAAEKYNLRLDVPIEDLTRRELDILYKGKGKWYGIKGFFDWLETKKYKVHVRVKLAKYRAYDPCPDCQGTRLKKTALSVLFREKTIADIFAMNIGDARRWWEFLALSKKEEAVAGHLRREILNRLVYLDEVGLSYLTLDRQTRTLSGGEAQRINLAAALGSGLTETSYVIDEPTVGLHARDSERLLLVLRRLRDSGNTVIVVEHDPTIIRGADYLVELGPGAGTQGGRLMFAGTATPDEAQRIAEGPEPAEDPVAVPPRDAKAGSVIIRGAREHNLKNIDVEIPLQALVAITGVSGSGKSTLIRDCLYNGFQRRYRGVANVEVGDFDSLEGLDFIEDIQFIDQSPIGRSTRSNPATYVKAWDDIRKVLSSTTSAKLQGVTASMFSFNTVGGRCETCQGTGTVTIDMQFLADVQVTCDQCDGKRFREHVLKVTYNRRNVDAILEMSVDEAIKFFIDRRSIVRKLSSLRAVGLGYLRLGQSTATLSGGEAQRLKLASFLTANPRNESARLFLFDEPTTGLHASDVRVLLATFRDLIQRGHSVVVIEHNLDMVAAADWVIDRSLRANCRGEMSLRSASSIEVEG
ncbi:MAG: excinuclease ABC subunit UvrA [Acidobacteria bacterium]|nr:excinuclease ABC subunit UvrA [Acidobacteriota bacterium]